MDRFLTVIQRSWADNELWRWVLAGVVLVVGFIVLLWLRKVLLKRFERFAEKTANKYDDLLVTPAKGVHPLFLAAASVYFGVAVLHVPDEVQHYANIVMIVAALIQAGILGQRLVNVAVAHWAAQHEDSGTATAAVGLRFAARFGIWTAVLLLALSNLGIEISALVAGLGVGGVAAALAVQSVLGDLFASIGVFFDRPFDMGDFIIVGDEMGTVEQTGLRSTRVRGLGGQQIVFPNADLLNSRIHNYHRMDERRVVLQVGVLYGTPADLVEKGVTLIRESIEAAERVRFERAHFKGFGASSLDYEAVYWILSREYNDFMDAQQTVNLGLMRRFEEAGLDFAFPTRTLHLESVPDNVVRLFDRDVRGDREGKDGKDGNSAHAAQSPS